MTDINSWLLVHTGPVCYGRPYVGEGVRDLFFGGPVGDGWDSEERPEAAAVEPYPNPALTPARQVAGITFFDFQFMTPIQAGLHNHNSAYLCIVLAGQYMERVGSQVRRCSPTSVTFHPPGESHQIQNEGFYREIVVLLNDEVFAHVKEHSKTLSRPFILRDELTTRLVQQLYKEFSSKDCSSALALEAITLELLVAGDRAQQKRAHTSPPHWIKQVREYLHDNYQSEEPVKILSEVAGVHPAHLARTFSKHFGCSIGEYIRRLRIDVACRELANRERTVCEIALALGFYDHAHFSRMFKRMVGVTPKEYRNNLYPH